MALVIKNKVFLDFIGEDYKEAYIIFKSIPAIEYESYQDRVKSLEDNNTGSLTFMVELLKEYFLSGMFPDDNGQLQPIVKDDLDGLNAEGVLGCFSRFTGQELDPKDKTPLTNSSSTVELPPENS